jgi:hypothetical protein
VAKRRGNPQPVGLSSIPRTLRPLARRAWAAGWTICVTTGGHLSWQAPGGEVVRTAASPSDANVAHVVERLLRRRGLSI